MTLSYKKVYDWMKTVKGYKRYNHYDYILEKGNTTVEFGPEGITINSYQGEIFIRFSEMRIIMKDLYMILDI